MSGAAMMALEVEQAKAEIAPVVSAANALTVTNVEEHTTALQMLSHVMAAERRVKALFAPAIEAAMESKRKAEAAREEVVGLRDSVLFNVTEARELISAKCRGFEEEERRVARLNQQRINAEALAAQEEQRLLDAAMADTEEEAEAAMTDPLPPPVTPTVKPDVAKVAGVITRETWAAEIVDKPAFLAWAAKAENNFYAEPNMPALNSRARAEKGALAIPGVKAVSKLTHAGR